MASKSPQSASTDGWQQENRLALGRCRSALILLRFLRRRSSKLQRSGPYAPYSPILSTPHPRINLKKGLRAISAQAFALWFVAAGRPFGDAGRGLGYRLASMQKQSTKTLYDYWNTLRGSRSAPDRRDIDPTKIRGALANTFILELNDSDEFDFRLAGSHICVGLCARAQGPLVHPPLASARPRRDGNPGPRRDRGSCRGARHLPGHDGDPHAQ